MEEYTFEELLYHTHLFLAFLICTFVFGPIMGRIRRNEAKLEDYFGFPLALAHGFLAYIMHMIL